MGCRQWDEAMMRYFDGQLNEREQLALKQHLTRCTSCAEEFNQLNTILGALEHDEAMPPPEGFEQEVMSKIYAYDLQRREEPRTSQRTLGAGIVAVFSLALIVLEMMFVNFNPIQVFWDIGSQIRNLSNLWIISSIIIRISKVFPSGWDILLIKTVLAMMIIYFGLVMGSKVQLLKDKMGF